MERKQAHHLLFEHLRPFADAGQLEELAALVDGHLALDRDAKEAGAQPVFEALADFAAEALGRKMQALPVR
jgi:hypothetical protein